MSATGVGRTRARQAGVERRPQFVPGEHQQVSEGAGRAERWETTISTTTRSSARAEAWPLHLHERPGRCRA